MSDNLQSLGVPIHHYEQRYFSKKVGNPQPESSDHSSRTIARKRKQTNTNIKINRKKPSLIEENEMSTLTEELFQVEMKRHELDTPKSTHTKTNKIISNTHQISRGINKGGYHEPVNERSNFFRITSFLYLILL